MTIAIARNDEDMTGYEGHSWGGTVVLQGAGGCVGRVGVYFSCAVFVVLPVVCLRTLV